MEHLMHCAGRWRLEDCTCGSLLRMKLEHLENECAEVRTAILDGKQDTLEASSGTSALNAGLCRAAFALYRPPFRFEHGYIWDAGNNMVADQDDACSDAVSSEIARVRGWGRICSMPEPMALQDKVGELIAAALTEYWTRHNV